jgi:hypothetical protein
MHVHDNYIYLLAWLWPAPTSTTEPLACFLTWSSPLSPLVWPRHHLVRPIPIFPAELLHVDYSSPWWWRQYAPLKCQSTSTRLHSATSQKAVIIILAAVRTLNLTVGQCLILSREVGIVLLTATSRIDLPPLPQPPVQWYLAESLWSGVHIFTLVYMWIFCDPTYI